MRLWVAALLSLLTLSPIPGVTTGDLRVTFRDSATGYRLAGTLRARAPNGEPRDFAVQIGEVLLASPTVGRWRLFANAPGHATLETEFEISSGDTLPVSLWLDPLT